ncbi:hypothetical protein [Spirosoma sp. KUDC1026]|uniref:hypothetical protein n=1 Tax=Spirosoma sp. KUDC1026 TaxID=2745947 RepID=UPI00159BE4DE|nr:hypothetical protein [Spirosoma sp. KUDC1026]QKZ12738.1 hypothetical protein HU175_08875 [Spirosoma sp. KUDC1026]
MKKWLIYTGCLLRGLIVLYLINRANNEATTAQTVLAQQKAAETKAEGILSNAPRDLVISAYTWQKREGGSTAVHSFSVHNTSKRHAYKAISLRFFYFSDLGTEVGRIDQVIDKVIQIGETVRVDRLELGMLPQHTYGADVEIID